jgi:hypothetical protein
VLHFSAQTGTVQGGHTLNGVLASWPGLLLAEADRGLWAAAYLVGRGLCWWEHRTSLVRECGLTLGLLLV